MSKRIIVKFSVSCDGVKLKEVNNLLNFATSMKEQSLLTKDQVDKMTMGGLLVFARIYVTLQISVLTDQNPANNFENGQSKMKTFS